MNILVIGSGGREHALVAALQRSASHHRLFALPGNPGIATVATCIAGSVVDESLLQEVCLDKTIDLVVFGPELPLQAGLADRVRSWGILAFGPGADGAELECSKVFAKDFMQRHSIPSAHYQVVADFGEMLAAYQADFVIKADGLAGGKGVFLPTTHEQYRSIAEDLFLNQKLGPSAERVVLEERLQGPEISFFYLLNGKTSYYLGSARDHKRAYEGGIGPNTGGMGAFTPVALTKQDRTDIKNIIDRTVNGLTRDGIDYRGVLFIGCMRTTQGLKVLEYNVRFGDPETQALQAQWGEGFDQLLLAAARGTPFPDSYLDETPSVCVVVCSEGYPDTIRGGETVTIGQHRHTTLFHAGTALKDGRLINQSGRVFNLVASGDTIEQARALVYDEINQIQFKGCWYRKDIADEISI